MILIITSLAWYTWDGPGWPISADPDSHAFDPNCGDNWYLNLLYVNNLFKADKQVNGLRVEDLPLRYVTIFDVINLKSITFKVKVNGMANLTLTKIQKVQSKKNIEILTKQLIILQINRTQLISFSGDSS